MAWQEGKRSRGDTGIRDSRTAHQLKMSMKALNVAATPENLDRVHQAIAGRKLSNKELDDLVKETFAEQAES